MKASNDSTILSDGKYIYEGWNAVAEYNLAPYMNRLLYLISILCCLSCDDVKSVVSADDSQGNCRLIRILSDSMPLNESLKESVGSFAFVPNDDDVFDTTDDLVIRCFQYATNPSTRFVLIFSIPNEHKELPGRGADGLLRLQYEEDGEIKVYEEQLIYDLKGLNEALSHDEIARRALSENDRLINEKLGIIVEIRNGDKFESAIWGYNAPFETGMLDTMLYCWNEFWRLMAAKKRMNITK